MRCERSVCDTLLQGCVICVCEECVLSVSGVLGVCVRLNIDLKNKLDYIIYIIIFPLIVCEL